MELADMIYLDCAFLPQICKCLKRDFVSGRGGIIFSHFRTIVKIDYLLRHIHPSVRTEQLGSHWTDCSEI